MPLGSDAAFWVTAAALTLVARFLIRDLLDGGENLIVMAMAWAAIGAWSAGRHRLAPLLLGAAIALKLTAAIFILILVIRRHYRQAAADGGLWAVVRRAADYSDGRRELPSCTCSDGSMA